MMIDREDRSCRFCQDKGCSKGQEVVCSMCGGSLFKSQCDVCEHRETDVCLSCINQRYYMGGQE